MRMPYTTTGGGGVNPGTPTTGLRQRGNDTSRGTGRSGRQNAATRRNMRREERVTVQGPVKTQQQDGMSHGGLTPPPPWTPHTRVTIGKKNEIYCWETLARPPPPHLSSNPSLPCPLPPFPPSPPPLFSAVFIS